VSFSSPRNLKIDIRYREKYIQYDHSKMDEFLSVVASNMKSILEEICLGFEAKVSDPVAREVLRKLVDRYTLSSGIEVKDNIHTDEICTHLMVSGKRRGCPCGKKVSPNSRLCKTHTPKFCMFLTKEGKCKREISRFSTSGKMCKLHVAEELGDKASWVRQNKYGNYWNQPTGLVFEGGKVIGKEDGEGQVILELDNDDLECIREYKFGVCDRLVPVMRAYVTGAPIPAPVVEAELVFED